METRIKGFDKNLQCRGMQFEVGKEYKIESTNLELSTDKVFHYCKTLKEVSHYYDVNSDNRFCYIEVLGEEVCDGDLCGSNHIKVSREIIGTELDLLLGKTNGNAGIWNSGHANAGNDNAGNGNSGHYNAGNGNAGDGNVGHGNSGNGNAGHHNAGHGNAGHGNAGNDNAGNDNTGNGNSGNGNTCNWNTGNGNTGNDNAGNVNSGHRNLGNSNTGDWNSCDYSSGFFCSKEPKAVIFNVETDMTVTEFKKSIYYKALMSVHFVLVEKIGGKTVKHTYKEACKKWWKAITSKNKEIIKSMPNFNAEVFEEITGITIRNKKEK